jgi:hypothetical protein
MKARSDFHQTSIANKPTQKLNNSLLHNSFIIEDVVIIQERKKERNRGFKNNKGKE